ncbi:hypothetical protein SpiGrapes_3059 [Sphaerochaeta pleomorpha str. Grapes]|uniref:Alpha/beta hydrolase fold-5 domain-containing protein n=1 Tax=Sphaerochaeta pleomorpha (strain ATCC BAA-1885 / DSM 22778 / Grapes) TaxID=158190 RepID=G8QYF9_SPHPG|nr:alpha/beta hydrolase [Sphaerochaeta pleomorpha]AEV30806.1 hypothetical protein SpiGrapes_3059 [Sphaerochaeta pleomorpha str. Grapes]
MKKKSFFTCVSTLLFLIALTTGTFTSCAFYKPLEEPFYQKTLFTLTEKTGDWITVKPLAYEGMQKKHGIVFYPGALVEPEAYMPLAQEIAYEAQVLVVIVPMPFDLAVLAPQRGAKVPEAFPNVTTWFAAGHSLGGAMAATLVEKHQQVFSGLILLAAYPAKSNDLSLSRLPVLSLSAQFDLLATDEKIEKAQSLLPADTRYVTIVGGNHAQFGNYGKQKGDGTALIEPEEQWEFTANEITEFLREL